MWTRLSVFLLASDNLRCYGLCCICVRDCVTVGHALLSRLWVDAVGAVFVCPVCPMCLARACMRWGPGVLWAAMASEGTILTAAEAERMVEGLRTFTVREVGTSRYGLGRCPLMGNPHPHF